MSKHSEQLRIDAALADAVAACERGLPPLHLDAPWEQAAGRARATAKEELLTLARLVRNPVTVAIEVAEVDGGARVALDGRNLGWGPLQDKHVRTLVRELADRIRQAAAGAGGAPADAALPASAPRAAPASAPAPAPSPPPRTWGEGRIFVSYRRDDTGYVTDAICDRLAQTFGRGAIFKDVDSIPLGVDFRQTLTDAVQRCDVLLAVIGRDWLAPGDDGTTPRLHDARDYVRIELEAALARGIPVIPVLVRVQTLPEAERLPESVREVVYFNGLPVRREPDFGGDVERLRRRLVELLGRAAGP